MKINFCIWFFPVYAMYDDISAEDFLHIQTDTEYRKEWDNSAIKLDVIDTDPVHRTKSHIIHWEMQWPVGTNAFYVYIFLFGIFLLTFFIFIHRNCFQIEIMCSTGDFLSIGVVN